MNGDDPDEMLAAVYAADGPEANRSLYARWAATYETGFVTDRRYGYPEQVVSVFAEHGLAGVGEGDAVVDVGCGTGLAGVALRRRAAVAVDGLDISPEMLQHAASKQHDGVPVYRELIEVDLTQPLRIESGTYAGVVSVGTFTHGHVGPASLDEVLRIVRPGGVAAIGINAAHFAAAGFGEAFDHLGSSGRIADLRLVDVPIYDGADMTDPDQFAHVALFTVG
ncbi:MAG: class I SAM-dependent methyltransferase [Ilumatobacteraceae bacterium]|nr:class I SAM-dependent methyltransferase [Acidimicrobiales bacterium]MCB9392243.1 class I SAM-dependent methyltransferase [Acidimicrobiaceae bacterium]